MDGLIDNDEKVASKKNISHSTLELQNHTLFDPKMAKIDTLVLTKAAKKPYPT